MYRSSDGIDWIQLQFPELIVSVSWLSSTGMYVAISQSNTLYFSSDASQWQKETSISTITQLTLAAETNHVLAVVGNGLEGNEIWVSPETK